MQEIVHTNALAPHQHECSTPTRIHNILTHREHIFFNTTTYSQTHRQYISLSLMLHISLFLFLSVFISLCIRLLDLLRFLSSVFLSLYLSLCICLSFSIYFSCQLTVFIFCVPQYQTHLVFLSLICLSLSNCLSYISVSLSLSIR